MENQTQPPAAPNPPTQVRTFKARCFFENNTCCDITIQSLDHIGMLAKLTAAAAEMVLQQPFRMLKIEVLDVTGQKIIMPGGRGGGALPPGLPRG